MSAPLIAVLGPTASGKSDLALDIAAAVGGEIVSCDSLQIYRYLDIGTAKVPLAARRGIRHHLIDIADPDRIFTAGEYARLARVALAEIASRGRVPVVAGGTGFYFRALLEGIFRGPAADYDLRARLAQRPERLHRLLARLDPAAAARIHSNDTKKLIRALEVCVQSRRPISELQPEREALSGYDVLKIGLAPPRALLHERIDARCRMMFERGLVDEVRSVVARFGRGAKALEAIGYREAAMLLEGRLPPAEAIRLTQLHTRQYARRQMTWFRREQGVNWFAASGDDPATKENAIRLARNQINISRERRNEFEAGP